MFLLAILVYKYLKLTETGPNAYKLPMIKLVFKVKVT